MWHCLARRHTPSEGCAARGVGVGGPCKKPGVARDDGSGASWPSGRGRLASGRRTRGHDDAMGCVDLKSSAASSSRRGARHRAPARTRHDQHAHHARLRRLAGRGDRGAPRADRHPVRHQPRPLLSCALRCAALFSPAAGSAAGAAASRCLRSVPVAWEAAALTQWAPRTARPALVTTTHVSQHASAGPHSLTLGCLLLPLLRLLPLLPLLCFVNLTVCSLSPRVPLTRPSR